MDEALNIFEYSDSKAFLKDYYSRLKEKNPNFSYRAFAMKVGIASVGQLHMMIEGDRNLTKDVVPKIASAIGLSKREQQFFDTLVSFNQAKNPEAKRYYLEILHNLRKDKMGTPLADAQFEYISKWYYPAVRELVYFPHFSDNPAWIKSALMDRVTIKQARQAVKTLLRLGLIKKNGEGRYEQTDLNLITNDEVAQEASYFFHQQMLSIAKEILSKTFASERQCSCLVMPMSAKQFHEVKKMMNEFEDNVIRFLSNNPDVPEIVYHFNNLLFPITKKANI